MADRDIWLITGVSTGLGRAMAQAALAAGKIVAGTVRTAPDRDAFESLAPGRAHGVLLDLSDAAGVADAVAGVEDRIGPIGVLVCNAGYGQEGPVEAVAVDQFRHQFDVNVIGTIATARAVIGPMRRRGGGRIVNISSATAFVAPASIAAYASSKAATSAFFDALAKEVEAFGIFVTDVIPGAFRTDWGGRSLKAAAMSQAETSYAHLDVARRARAERSGTQRGDPAKFADAILRLAEMESPPQKLVLGADGLQAMRAYVQRLSEDIERHVSLSESTDFD